MLCIDCSDNVTSLLGHERHLYVGTRSGNVKVYDSESCTLLKQFSLHAGKVCQMLKLPTEVHQCVCAEKMVVTNDQCVRTESMLDLSDESVTPRRRISQEHALQQDSSLSPDINGTLHSFTSILEPSTNLQCIKAPLIISLGHGTANWLNMENIKEAVQPHLLTWSGYGII